MKALNQLKDLFKRVRAQLEHDKKRDAELGAAMERFDKAVEGLKGKKVA